LSVNTVLSVNISPGINTALDVDAAISVDTVLSDDTTLSVNATPSVDTAMSIDISPIVSVVLSINVAPGANDSWNISKNLGICVNHRVGESYRSWSHVAVPHSTLLVGIMSAVHDERLVKMEALDRNGWPIALPYHPGISKNWGQYIRKPL